jgi:hypothetical protein
LFAFVQISEIDDIAAEDMSHMAIKAITDIHRRLSRHCRQGMEKTKSATSRVALLNRASCNATAQYVNTGKIGTKFQKPLTSESWHDPNPPWNAVLELATVRRVKAFTI